jgi:GNAT superfamily N-acetyltransferase
MSYLRSKAAENALRIRFLENNMIGNPFGRRSMIRDCGLRDFDTILNIVNKSAEAYRAFIPAEEWKDPYMPAEELRQDLTAGVGFVGWEEAGGLVGIMGLQPVHDVALIRHAYVRPDRQRSGVGSALLGELCRRAALPMLVGTWAASSWAIRFYQMHGFRGVPEARREALLRGYWTVPDAQIAASVVLADVEWWRQQGGGEIDRSGETHR